MRKNKTWFTFIELLIVISVLAILGTVSFLSFKNYSAWARDAKRISDLNNIQKQLYVHESKAWILPRPEEYITIKSWAEVIWYQWEVWLLLQQNLQLSDNTRDNKREEFYTYNTNLARDNFVLTAYLERPDTKTAKNYNVSFDDNKKLILNIWNPIWVLLNKNTWELAQKDEIDIDVAAMTNYNAQLFPWVIIPFDKIKYLNQIYKTWIRENCQDYLEASDSFKNDNTMFFTYKDWVFTETNCDMQNL